MASETMASGGHREKDLKTSRVIEDVEKETKPLRGFLRKFGNDWATTFAGALAYSLLTALLPIAIAIVAIAGFILSNILKNPNGTQIIFQALGGIPGLGSAQSSLNQSVSQRLSSSSGALAIIAIFVAIFGGSRLFIAMEGCMDIIYHVRPRKFLAKNIMAIGMMIIFSILVPIMLFASTLPAGFLGLINNAPALKKIPFLMTLTDNPVTTLLAGYAGALIAAFLLFEAVYLVVPNQRISFRHSWPGALVAAIALEIFVGLFPLYTGTLMKSYVGQIGFAVVIVAFLYYFAVILILGAEVNAYFFEKVKPLPNDLATFVTTLGGTLNQDRPESESPSHVNPRPTEHADEAHIERVAKKEDLGQEQQQGQQQSQQQDRQQGQQQDQQQDRQQGQQTQREYHYERPQQHGKIWTTLGVLAGSVLAFIVQFFQIRRHAR
jgi:YihY family inner membrane protein